MRYKLVKQGENKYVLVGLDGTEVDVSDFVQETQKDEIENRFSEQRRNEYTQCELLENLVDTVIEMNAVHESLVRDLISVLSKYVG